MHHRISTYITEQEREALIKLAVRERLDPRAQAAVLIAEGLERRSQDRVQHDEEVPSARTS